MSESQLVEGMELSKEGKENYELKEALRQFGSKIKELETSLAVINRSICELSQPLTVILGLSELLLAKVDRNDPIAVDLATISKQVNRMREIIERVNRLSDNKPVGPY